MPYSAQDFLARIDASQFGGLGHDFTVTVRDARYRPKEIESFGDVIFRLYDEARGGSQDAREELHFILRERMNYVRGPWRGIKGIFKRAEIDREGDIYGMINRVLDGPRPRGVGRATVDYLRRRAWRVLRVLGKRDPAAYAPMAAWVMASYTEAFIANNTYRTRVWAFNHIGWHGRGPAINGRRGNRDNYYSKHNWGQRAEKNYWWERDQWRCESLDEYPFPEAWDNRLDAILPVLPIAETGVGAAFLIHLANTHCAAQLERITSRELWPLFEAMQIDVAKAAMTWFDAVDPATVEVDGLLTLLLNDEADVRQFGMNYLEKHVAFERIPVERLTSLTGCAFAEVATWAAQVLRDNLPESAWTWEMVQTWLASPYPGVRDEAINVLKRAWQAIGITPEQTFELAENEFDVVRQWAFMHLIEDLPFDALDREAIFGLLDSDYTDTRTFAMRLIEKHLAALRALQDLGRLAEHPEPKVQHWVVSLVKQHLRDDPDRLVDLMPFFRVVVFHVNRGTEEKKAIFSMLADLAVANRSRATAVVKLCSEFVHAFGRGEFVKSLVGLARLYQRYPDLDVPIDLAPVPTAETAQA